MSIETLPILKKLDPQSIEYQLALQAAPVLKGIKIANLILILTGREDSFYPLVAELGLSAFKLGTVDEKTVFLLYRRKMLERYLRIEDNLSFLRKMGYEENDLYPMLKKLSERYLDCTLHGGQFPHEMGIFLGYPLDDVQGFIQNKGRNYLLVGHWMVYFDLEAKKRIFESYDRAQEEMFRQMAKGHGLKELCLIS